MAASRGNRLSGCGGEEAASVGAGTSSPWSTRTSTWGSGVPKGCTTCWSHPGLPDPKFLLIPIWVGRGDTQTNPGGCSPAVSAHSTIWGSGKWQRNPAPPGSPEILQGSGTSVTGCVPSPTTTPLPAHLLCLLTGQVAPGLPHAPHRGVLRLLPARGSQERVILQLGEALGAVDEKAEMGCHLRGVWVPCQTLTAGDRGCQGQWLIPTPWTVTRRVCTQL